MATVVTNEHWVNGKRIWGWQEAQVTIFAGTDWGSTREYGENWRLSLCAPGLFNAGDKAEPHNRCPLPVAQMLASAGYRSKEIPAEVARYLVDPCTQIAFDHMNAIRAGALTHREKVERAEQLAAVREKHAEHRAAKGVRV